MDRTGQDMAANPEDDRDRITRALAEYLPLDPVARKVLLPAGITRIWIDVGAHEAETTLSGLDSAPNAMILAFEPLPEKFEQLRRRHPRLVALPFAVPPSAPPSWWASTAWATGALLLVLNVAAINRVSRAAKQVTGAANP